MTASATLLPPRRPELVIRPLGEKGQYVVKDPRTKEFFHIGPEEHFLLMQLDGKKDAGAICAAFTKELSQPLSEEELAGFVEMAQKQGFLLEVEESPLIPDPSPSLPGQEKSKPSKPIAEQGNSQGHRNGSPPKKGKSRPKKKRQSILYWRKSLFDPDRFITWLEPKIRFFWTSGFLVLSTLCLLAALGISWTSREQVVSSFASSLRWETVFWVWMTIFVVTMLHEFAHGLTCKHFGGEVHEIGFLLMFFMPCFYCNVSDAWLFKEKSKRLWVTFAGGYFELFLWALAVFVWRLTVPDSMVNYLAFVVLASCGIQSLFNFNPLIKLDGYYLLSDWLEIPNLRQRGLGRWLANVRWLLWGAPQPGREPRGRFLFFYGMVSFGFSFFFLGLMVLALGRFAYQALGWVGLLPIAFLGLVSYRGLLHGVSAGEVRKMFLFRYWRLALWLLILGAGGAALVWVPIEDRAGGTFEIRAPLRAEIRAPVSGFIKEIRYQEGERVYPGTTIVFLEIPDLESRLAQQRAEVQEVQAKLQLLKTGPRPEEVDKLEQQVQLAQKWLDVGEKDLKRVEKVFTEELTLMEKKVEQFQAEVEAAESAFQKATKLFAKNALSADELSQAKKGLLVSNSLFQQALAEKKVHLAKGTFLAEQEVVRRGKELAEAQAALKLLQAGFRPEEIQAEQAHLSRLQEEVHHLEQIKHKLEVFSPVAGIVTTPHLRDKIGQYVREGDLIALVEEPGELEAEIKIIEADASPICLGQPVSLKVRALPLETFSAEVTRISSTVTGEEWKKTLTVTCPLKNSDGKLQPGMSGYARIYTEQRTLGGYLFHRVQCYVRTEFWW